MRPHRPIPRTTTCLITIALVALAGCSSDESTGQSSSATDYCTSHGGVAETREPYWGTNLDQGSWTQLAGDMDLCRFEDTDGARIYVDTQTLSSTEPSLAALAYLAKLPVPSTAGGANPATLMCQDTIGGASTWGTGANGGGWVNLDDPTFTVVDLCVFADGSAIDQWGIAYYSGDVVRGADLADKFAFDTTGSPAIFTKDATS